MMSFVLRMRLGSCSRALLLALQRHTCTCNLTEYAVLSAISSKCTGSCSVSIYCVLMTEPSSDFLWLPRSSKYGVRTKNIVRILDRPYSIFFCLIVLLLISPAYSSSLFVSFLRVLKCSQARRTSRSSSSLSLSYVCAVTTFAPGLTLSDCWPSEYWLPGPNGHRLIDCDLCSFNPLGRMTNSHRVQPLFIHSHWYSLQL